MSHEKLIGLIAGDLDVSVDETDALGRLWPVARGRLVGGDQRLNTLVIDTGGGQRTVVELTSRHRVAYALPAPRATDSALLANAA